MGNSITPPRAYFPVTKPLALYPTPDTGVIIITFDCQDGHPVAPEQSTFYTLIVRRETLLGLVTDEMLRTCRTAEYRPPLIAFATIAPFVRFRSTDEQQGWVCFVYHYRYITGESSSTARGTQHLIVNDFDPIRTKREILKRKHLTAVGTSSRQVQGCLPPDQLQTQPPRTFSSARRRRLMPGSWRSPRPAGGALAPDEDTETDSVDSGPGPPTTLRDEEGFDLTDLEGEDDDGIYLHIEEDFLDAEANQHIKTSFRTGSKVGGSTDASSTLPDELHLRCRTSA